MLCGKKEALLRVVKLIHIYFIITTTPPYVGENKENMNIELHQNVFGSFFLNTYYQLIKHSNKKLTEAKCHTHIPRISKEDTDIALYRNMYTASDIWQCNLKWKYNRRPYLGTRHKGKCHSIIYRCFEFHKKASKNEYINNYVQLTTYFIAWQTK